MTDRAALYAAVCANPEDDTVRLAFADFLEEYGDAKRAGFIRTQVAAHAAREADTPAGTLFRGFSSESVGGSAVDWAAVDPELAAVFAADRNGNRGKLTAKAEGLPKLKGVTFQGHQRGFFHHVHVQSGEVFARHAAAIFRAAPVTDVEFDELHEEDAEAVASSGYLGRIRCLTATYGLEAAALEVLGCHPDAAGIQELHLDGTDEPVEQLAALAAGRHWSGLRRLELIDFDEGDDDDTDRAAGEVFRRKPFRGLVEVSAWGCGLGVETARSLAAGQFPALRKLDLGINGIPNAGGEALAAAKGMPGLRHLDLSSNDIRSGEVMASLIASPNFPELTLLKLDGNNGRVPGPKAWPTKSRGPSLRMLEFGGNTLSDSGAAGLFSQPALKGLWRLDVSGCGLTDRGLRALAANLDQLMSVGLSSNPFSGAALAEFVNRPAAARLQWLDLSDVKLGTAGVNALANSEYLANLKHLSVTDRGLVRLVKRFGRKVVNG